MREAEYGEGERVMVQNGEGERFPVTIRTVREEGDAEPLYFVEGRLGVCAWVRESDIIAREAGGDA